MLEQPELPRVHKFVLTGPWKNMELCALYNVCSAKKRENVCF